MKRLTTTQKLWGTLGIIWIAMLLLVGWLAWENRQTLENERRASIEHIVKSVHGQLEALQKRAELGELTEAEAQQRGKSWQQRLNSSLMRRTTRKPAGRVPGTRLRAGPGC